MSIIIGHEARKLMSRFKNRVIKIVRLVPAGMVVSYSQVALYVGVPRAARQVGWILRSIETKVDLPWWRVINNAGRITIKGNKYNNQDLQRKLLLSEGIPVSKEYTLDINKYRFIPSANLLKKMELKEDYIEVLLKKYFTM